jgi:hypothetical protein
LRGGPLGALRRKEIETAGPGEVENPTPFRRPGAFARRDQIFHPFVNAPILIAERLGIEEVFAVIKVQNAKLLLRTFLVLRRQINKEIA